MKGIMISILESSANVRELIKECSLQMTGSEDGFIDFKLPVREIEKRIKANPKIKVIFTTLCETSTGVVNDIKAIGKIVKMSQAVLVVDAISGLGATPLLTDAWFCDVIVVGSQKGLMLPPGLGFISVSPKAWGLVEQSKCPKYSWGSFPCFFAAP